MRTLVLCAVFAFRAEGPVSTDTADIIEVNHYYDANGKHVFDQVIFWDWHDDDCTFRVAAWRFLKPENHFPRRDPVRGGYVHIWKDEGRLRCVRSKWFRETWTQYDPEVNDREFLTQRMRRGLIGTYDGRRITQR